MTSGGGSLRHRFAAWSFAAIFLATTWQLAAAQALPKNFALHDQPKAVAAITFNDAQGRPRSLADFKGKIFLLNIWATWCFPCRREMPALDRLQTALGGPDFEVVPLSVDHRGIETVRKFYAEIGIRNLAVYIDASGKAVREAGAVVGLPITLLVDRAGYEIGRIVGPAEWDTRELAEFLRAKF
jgi:thiol-disulfide isomerase/thioredoxin